MTANRIAVGTVQFGLAYGVANQTGQVSLDESARILSIASRAGCDTLDTAITYGESESRLGTLGVGDWRIVTKLPAIPADVEDARQWVSDMIADSLGRMRLGAAYGVLLHRAADLMERHGRDIVAGLLSARDAGLTQRIGVSVYDPDDLEVLGKRLPFDLVQAPFNVLDRRIVRSGWARRLREEGVEIHTRSVFLQGLLLMPAASRPARFARFASTWEAWDTWLSAEGVSALDACLGVAMAEPVIDRVVVGADSAAQMQEIIMAAERSAAPPPEALESEDPLLFNPSMWAAL